MVRLAIYGPKLQRVRHAEQWTFTEIWLRQLYPATQVRAMWKCVFNILLFSLSRKSRFCHGNCQGKFKQSLRLHAGWQVHWLTITNLLPRLQWPLGDFSRLCGLFAGPSPASTDAQQGLHSAEGPLSPVHPASVGLGQSSFSPEYFSLFLSFPSPLWHNPSRGEWVPRGRPTWGLLRSAPYLVSAILWWQLMGTGTPGQLWVLQLFCD